MRLVVFDLDGTLIDSVTMIVETMTRAFTALGEAVPDEAAIRSISGINPHRAMAILAPGADAARIDALLQSFHVLYTKEVGGPREPMFTGALEALERLNAEPQTLLAVATGKGLRGTMSLLERHGIADRFTSIETPDHNYSKPDPQMLHSAMSKAGVAPHQTVMIGDTVHDMHMARAGGVRAIGVSWGYHGADELAAAGADAIIHDFDELDAAIKDLVGAGHA